MGKFENEELLNFLFGDARGRVYRVREFIKIVECYHGSSIASKYLKLHPGRFQGKRWYAAKCPLCGDCYYREGASYEL